MQSFINAFTVWNRKLHFYLGLYLLFFVWLFALSGLLLNHSSWAFAQFYPNRRITKFEKPIQPLSSTSDLERARELMQQLGIQGEVNWTPARPDGTQMRFNVARPGTAIEIQADLEKGQAKVTVNEYNVYGIMRTMHTFVGVNPEDSRNQRDWVLTTVWALSMDAVAIGVIYMVLSSYYMWWRLREKRKWGAAALSLGVVVGGLFVFGLRWMYA